MSSPSISRRTVVDPTEELIAGSGPGTVEVESHAHHIACGGGAVLHVLEKTSALARQRPDRRAVLFLPGTLVTNNLFDLPLIRAGDQAGDTAAGPSALEYAATQGFYAFCPSYEGYGLSSCPEDGRSVTAERLLAQLGHLVAWIRYQRRVDRVDVVGVSLGASLAIALGGRASPVDENAIGKLVLTSMIYRDVSETMRDGFFSAQARQMLERMPQGYAQTIVSMYAPLLINAEPHVAAWVHSNFPGIYAVGPTLAGFSLPIFAGRDGRASALQFWGEHDALTPRHDVATLQREYGGPIRLATLPNTGHAPVLEPVRLELWRQTFAFLSEVAGGYQH